MAKAGDILSHGLCCLAVIALFAATFNPYLGAGWVEGANIIFKGIGVIGALCLCLRWRLARELYRRTGEAAGRLGSCPPHRIVGIECLIFFAVAAILSQVMFAGLPHVADSHGMYMHSKIMASGKWCETSPRWRIFFTFQSMINTRAFCSVSFPGHVMLLTLGQWVGAPWLVNPLMGALGLIAIFLLARELDGKTTALIAASMALLCKYFIFMSSEYMNSVSSMFFLVMFVYAYVRMVDVRLRRYALLAGVCIGCAFITRVQSTVPFTLPIVLHGLWLAASKPRSHALNMVIVGVMAMPFVGFLLYYNIQLTGEPLITAYQKSDNNGLSLYIGRFAYWQSWREIGTDISRALVQISMLHRIPFGWFTSSLLFVPLLFMLRSRPHYSGLLMACCLSQGVALIFLFGMSGTVFEPRYIYESVALLIILSAAAIRRLPAVLHHIYPAQPMQVYQGIVTATLGVFYLSAVPTVYMFYTLYSHNFFEGNESYYRYVMEAVEKPALVFLPYEQFRWVYFTMPPHDDSPVIFVHDRGERDILLMMYYPKRHVYIGTDTVLMRVR